MYRRLAVRTLRGDVHIPRTPPPSQVLRKVATRTDPKVSLSLSVDAVPVALRSRQYTAALESIAALSKSSTGSPYSDLVPLVRACVFLLV